jgi:vesicle transport through interaction with t-SNAREs protein 1
VVDVVVSQTVEIEGELSEAEGFIRAMEVEFKSLSAAEKRNAQQKVNDFRAELKQMTANFQQAKYNAESLALKGGGSARTKLLNANQRLDSSTATLEQSRQILYQTEAIGDAVISDLENQKEKLVDAREKVKDTKRFTVDAKHILRMMSNRALMHKLCVMLTILLLFGAIIGIGYYGIVMK